VALLLFTVPSLYVLVTDWQPIWLVLLSAAATVALLPLTVPVLLALTSDRRRMGEHTSGLATKVVMTLVVLAALYLTWQNARALIARRLLIGHHLADARARGERRVVQPRCVKAHRVGCRSSIKMPVGKPPDDSLAGSAARTTDGTENCPALAAAVHMNIAPACIGVVMEAMP